MTDTSPLKRKREQPQVRQESTGPSRPAAVSGERTPPDQTYPLLDLGLFLIAYLFFLIVVSNVLLLFGVPISRFHCLAALPPSWVTLWLLRGRKTGYTLGITLASAVVVFLCAYAVCFLYDFSWDGVWYHKVDTGLLKWGWNPFAQSMGDFAYESGIITAKTDWQVWFDGYPKGTYTIGACFYALLGSIEAGKCFNFIGMIALIGVGTALIQKIGRLKAWQAGAVAFLLAVNPVSLIKATSYYNDGFMAAMLTVFMLSLSYLYLHDKGDLAASCRALVFLSLGIGLNTKYSSLIFFGILGGLFYFLLVRSRIRGEGARKARPYVKRITVLFAVSVLCAVLLAGATTYIVNLVRYHNPLYSVIGENATPLADQEMPVFLREYPKILQFIVSIFSKATNDIYLTTSNYLKLPFTVYPEEWAAASQLDVRSCGWGLLFSAVFILSAAAVAAGLYALRGKAGLARRRRLILLLLLFLFIPPFFVPGMWWARYNVQLFWLPAAALCLLFAARNSARAAGDRLKAAGAGLLSLIIAGLMLFNLSPAFLYFQNQAAATKGAKEALDTLKMQDTVLTYHLTFYNDEMFGMAFNFLDEGIGYTMEPAAPDAETVNIGMIHSYVTVDAAIAEPDGKPETTEAFLASLQENAENLCVFIAAYDEASFALNDQIVRAVQALGLDFALDDQLMHSYIAVAKGGAALYENISPDRQEYTGTVDGHTVNMVSAGFDAGPDASIEIDGFEYAPAQRGLNIVVYDLSNRQITDAVVIDTYLDNTLKRFWDSLWDFNQ